LLFEYDAGSHIYGVELQSGDAIPVAVGNVRVPTGTVGTVVGLPKALDGAPQYNGALARVLSHNDDIGSYVVAVDDTQILLKRSNLRV
jgi:hypothetical protein